jgi:hypothetical protein
VYCIFGTFHFQEDFLATDDLFVDYFNAYLSLPVSNSPKQSEMQSGLNFN